ncbi:cytochrome P450 monooxygenase CYP63 [Auricularia subglabra TFB-10046 SS5]|nr:cytochrome P450 monooxygenase CYP63 [Auricularia subglabra TFB-10046 SS5]
MSVLKTLWTGEPDFANFRLALVLLLVRIVGLPVLFAQAAIVLSGWTPSALVKWLVVLPLSIPSYWTVRNAIKEWLTDREAAKLGAQPIPKVRGKWPGGLDNVLEFARAYETEYGTLEFRRFFEERKATTLMFNMLWQDVIFTIDDGHIKYILSSGFSHFEKGEQGRYVMEGVFGNGIFNRDGDLWKMHRAMTRPFFSRDRISDFITIGRHTDVTLGVISKLSPHSAIDVQDLYARFTIDAAAEFLFGTQLHSLRAPLPVAGRARMGPKGSATDGDAFGSFVQAFDDAQVRMAERFHLHPLWMAVEFFKDSTKEPMSVVRGYLAPIVQRALDDHAAAVRKGVKLDIDECTLLQYLVANTDDKTILRDEIINILIAGRDTTAALLTFTTYLLALHPDVFRQLRHEVLAVCGPDQPPTYETIRDMKYLRAVLNEALRLFPPVPINQRKCGKGSAVFPPSSAGAPAYHVPAGTDIIYIPLLMHRRTDLWGPDAETFNPERWIDPERVKQFVSNPMIFIPFNAGPRICLGQQFAYNEASFFLARLLQKFSAVELAPEAAPKGAAPPAEWKTMGGRQAIEQCWPKDAIILFAKGGLWARFTPVATA